MRRALLTLMLMAVAGAAYGQCRIINGTPEDVPFCFEHNLGDERFMAGDASIDTLTGKVYFCPTFRTDSDTLSSQYCGGGFECCPEYWWGNGSEICDEFNVVQLYIGHHKDFPPPTMTWVRGITGLPPVDTGPCDNLPPFNNMRGAFFDANATTESMIHQRLAFLWKQNNPAGVMPCFYLGQLTNWHRYAVPPGVACDAGTPSGTSCFALVYGELATTSLEAVRCQYQMRWNLLLTFTNAPPANVFNAGCGCE